MKKISIGVLFGGKSTEHDVSIVSATSIIENMNKQKYNIIPFYIEKDGTWYKYTKDINEIHILKLGEKLDSLQKLDNVFLALKECDVVFPVLHGKNGEDGTVQGIFETLKIPYVGCGILASSVGMDKVYSKIIFERAGIKQTPYEYIQKKDQKYVYINKNFEEEEISLEEICNKVQTKLNYPMFIKPSNSGSSVGIKKAHNLEELANAIEFASQYDYKILIEQGVDGKEVECAVLGNNNVIASCVGEIIPAEEYYSFDAKYNNVNSITQIPANIKEEQSTKIKEYAKKAFKAIGGKGLARVDFFIENETGEIYINEINTMPGFTNISMYPQLMKKEGITYVDLLDRLIDLALEKNI